MGTKIEWAEETWNPVRGCVKVSAGCANCYAERIDHRWGHEFRPRLAPLQFDKPRKLKKPSRIFVCSMSDLFQDFVADEDLDAIFEVIEDCPEHLFYVLTKRPERMAMFIKARYSPPLPNLWLGTSVENVDALTRADTLSTIPAAVRFLSVEPLLGPIFDLPLEGIDWVILGGESGQGSRPMDPAWARLIRNQARAARVPFFFKQWGGNRMIDGHWGGNVLDGRTWTEEPER